VLSCVKVMIALGGKREKGALKKKACMPVFGAGVEEVVIVCGGCEERNERNVKKTVVTKKAAAMITLGGRMMCV
jgi:microcompartment protein CcmK/EutM